MSPSASPRRRDPATFPGLLLLLLLALQLLMLLPPLLPPAAASAAPPPPAALPIAAAAAAAPRASNSSSSRTGPPVSPAPAGNSSGTTQLNRVSALLRDLPALKAAVIGACAASAGLIACLLFRVLRSGRKTKKTRKYDIITTPAERVEMAPLNEDEDDEEDSTVFDIKYR